MDRKNILPFSFSLSGVNPNFILVLRLLVLNDRIFRRIRYQREFFEILRDMQTVPFLSHQEGRFMLMCGGSMVKVLRTWSHSKNFRFSELIYMFVLKRIMKTLLLKIGSTGIESCLRAIASYSARSEDFSAMIEVSSSVLHNIKLSSSQILFESSMLFLLSQLPTPGNALQHLTDSDNQNVKMLIMFREIRKLWAINDPFCTLIDCSCVSYHERKRVFYRSSKSKSFKELRKSIRILQSVFPPRHDARMNFHDVVEEIIGIFFELMSRTDRHTWRFLGRAFIEESDQKLLELCSNPQEGDDENFSFVLRPPPFSVIPQSSEMISRLREIHLFESSPKALDFLEHMSREHYEKAWESVIACGLYWFLMMIELIKAGSPDLDFALHCVVHEPNDSFFTFILELFLNGAVNSSELCRFWSKFELLRGEYSILRKEDFSLMISKFFEVLNLPNFVARLQDFCSGDFERNFSLFCGSIRNYVFQDIVGDFFYPRTRVLCRYCKRKILWEGCFKRNRTCERCCEERRLDLWSDDE
jgi:hypothetical protein